MENQIKNVSIIGMGALGLLYATHIKEQLGTDAVTFIMDEARVEKYRGQTFTVNGEPHTFNVKSYKDAGPADLLIIAVKYTALEDAIREMRGCLGKDTVVISVLNGITSEKIIAEHYPDANIVHTVAQGMDAMKFGNELSYTQMGKLHVGVLPGRDTAALERLCGFFEEIKMPYYREEDILYRMWFKFMLNVGVNQVCMVYETDYEGILAEGEANRMFIAAMREVEVLALAEGVTLTETDINQCIEIEKSLNPKGIPSMAQDRVNRKHSEVEMFAGTVISMAEKRGILVPANRFLYKRVAEIEKEYV